MKKFLFLLLGLLSIANATTNIPSNNTINSQLPANIQVSFGKPTYIQKLYYITMYSKKPYHDAILFLYDNGMYKIISPGEEHYGVYVIKGNINDKQYTIHFMAIPSVDWGNKTAYLELHYNNQTHHFNQATVLQTKDLVPNETGTFETKTNTIIDPLNIKWANGKYLK